MRGLRIARTDRNGGLYFLDFHDKNPLRHALGNFWRHFFAFHLGYDGAPCLGTLDSLQNAYGTLFHTAPELVSAMRKGVRKLAAEFQSQVIRRRCLLSESSWAAYPPLLRPLTGYMHPFLQNANYSAESRIAILKLLELLASLVCDHLSPRTMAFHK